MDGGRALVVCVRVHAQEASTARKGTHLGYCSLNWRTTACVTAVALPLPSATALLATALIASALNTNWRS